MLTGLEKIVPREVTIDFTSSLSLIGERKDSYKLLYEDIASSLRDIIKTSLRKDEEITETMNEKARVFAGQKGLTKEDFEGQRKIDQI